MGENVQEPHTTIYDLAKIYEVYVDNFLKGSGPDNFYIIHSEGITLGLTPEALQEKVANGEFEYKNDSLLSDYPYLMFLNPFYASEIFPEVPKGVYYRQTSPGIFDISDQDKVRVVDIDSANPYFDFSLPLDQVVTFIKNPELIPPTPTPVIEPTEGGPYPYP